MKVSYRSLNIADYERVVEICKARPFDWIPSKFKKWIKDSDINKVYGVEIEDENGERILVGFGCVVLVHGSKCDYQWWEGVRIHKDFQNKGIGQQFFVDSFSLVKYGTKIRYNTISHIVKKFVDKPRDSRSKPISVLMTVPLWYVKVKTPVEDFILPTKKSGEFTLTQVEPFEFSSVMKQLTKTQREKLIPKGVFVVGAVFFDFCDIPSVLYQYPGAQFWVLFDKEKNVVSFSSIVEFESSIGKYLFVTVYDIGNQESVFLHLQNAKLLSEKKGYDFMQFHVIGDGEKLVTIDPSFLVSLFERDLTLKPRASL